MKKTYINIKKISFIFFCNFILMLYTFCSFSIEIKTDAKGHIIWPESTGIEEILNKDGISCRTQWTSRNGLPKEWWLKNFDSQTGAKEENISLLEGVKLSLLLEPNQGPIEPYFLVSDGERFKELAKDWWQLYVKSEGWGIHQALLWREWKKDHYYILIDLSLDNLSDRERVLQPGIRFEVSKKASSTDFFQTEEWHPIYGSEKGVTRIMDTASIETLQTQKGMMFWAGLENRYFLQTLIFDEQTDLNEVRYGRDGDNFFIELRTMPVTVAPDSGKNFFFKLYLGPKDYKTLYYKTLLGPEPMPLKKAIRYSWIVVPSLKWLNKIYRYIPHWGLMLLILAVFSQIILYPFTRKTKFKTLPLILQIPIYLLLYQIVYYSIEFRHAAFLFYQDLASPDPYFILPILCGLALFLLYFISPQVKSKKVDWLFKISPLLMTLLCIFLPLGLVWFLWINLLIALLLQWRSHQKVKKKESKK